MGDIVPAGPWWEIRWHRDDVNFDIAQDVVSNEQCCVELDRVPRISNWETSLTIERVGWDQSGSPKIVAKRSPIHSDGIDIRVPYKVRYPPDEDDSTDIPKTLTHPWIHADTWAHGIALVVKTERVSCSSDYAICGRASNVSLDQKTISKWMRWYPEMVKMERHLARERDYSSVLETMAREKLGKRTFDQLSDQKRARLKRMVRRRFFDR